jgi:hypothetical protein
MKGKILIVALLAVATLAAAQPANEPRVQILFADFDVASTSLVYCNSGGAPVGIACATGTADDDGAVTVAGSSPKAIQVEVDAITATSLDFVIQGRLLGAENRWAQIWPASGDHAVTAVGSFIVQVPDWVNQVRLGVKVDTDTAGAEDLDVVFNQFRE